MQDLTESAHHEQVVFFVDILGSSEAVTSWERTTDQERLLSYTKLLQNIKRGESEFDFKQPLDSTGYLIRPAIATFSDLIVISFDVEQMQGAPGLYDSVFFHAASLIGVLARETFGLELLIRGGATVGSLYHRGGVVFGKALIDGHNLECKVSRYPRITVSRELYQLPLKEFADAILTDHDGVKYLDYISYMVVTAGASKDERVKWFDSARELTIRKIDMFEQDEAWNKMSKWVWFKENLEAVPSRMPHLF